MFVRPVISISRLMSSGSSVAIITERVSLSSSAALTTTAQFVRLLILEPSSRGERASALWRNSPALPADSG